MKFLFFTVVISLFSFNSYAEKCEGMNACVALYSKLTGEQVEEDKAISDEMSLAVPETDLTNENVKAEFVHFLSKNVVSLQGKTLTALRHGDFLTAPIYVISENNLPRMINKDGPVTLVYQSKKETKELVTAKVRRMLSKKKAKSVNGIVELPAKVISVSDTYEKAMKIMAVVMKADK